MARSRRLTMLGAVVWTALSMRWPAGPLQAAGAAGTAFLASEGPRYLGASTCSGAQCHGQPEPGDRQRSRQVEFTIWSQQDKHRHAYDVLDSDLSTAIAKHLRLAVPPRESSECLNCHSLNVVEPARRGRDFKLSDGVSCDACHGPAEQWFGPHLNEPYEESVRKGMTDVRNPVVRAEVCLSCHLGNREQGRVVSHALLAAGHPPLEFELAAYSLKMHPHWREAKESTTNLPRAQLWAIGQLVALSNSLRLLSQELESGHWPDYAHFDCGSCHHNLTPNDWRKLRPRDYSVPPLGSTTVGLGRPPWGPGSRLPWISLLSVADSQTSNLRVQLDRLRQQFANRPFGDMSTVAPLASQLELLVRERIQTAAPAEVGPESAGELARSLCQSGDRAIWRGPDAARHLVYALDSLSYQNPAMPASTREQIIQLGQDLRDRDGTIPYDPLRILDQLRAIVQR